jgi:hypothetical protein
MLIDCHKAPDDRRPTPHVLAEALFFQNLYFSRNYK